MDERRERDGEYEPTRAYDRGDWAAHEEPTQRFEPVREPAPHGSTAGDGGAPQQRTDEIELPRPPRYDEAPRYQEAARPAAPLDRDLRPGWSGEPTVDALARLERETPGPRPWARVLSLVLSLIAIAPIVWLIDDLRGAQQFDSVVLQALPFDFELLGMVISGSVAALLLVIGLTGGLSGLGPSAAGLVAIVAGAALWFVHGTQYSAGMAISLGGAAFLIIIGALLLAVGIGAHFARRGGYRRALRIVRQAHRM